MMLRRLGGEPCVRGNTPRFFGLRPLLLTTTAVAALLIAQSVAHADGGAGGAGDAGYNSGVGGAGGTGSTGNSGSAGGDDTFYGGGGGGGGAAGGGAGGQGGAGDAGTHAAGGTSGSPDGARGDDQVGYQGGSGGGGGYGGDHGTVAGSIANTGSVSGDNGGNGGGGGTSSGTGGGGGGGGGAGGFGAIATDSGNSSNSGGGAITGGAGGNGGDGGTTTGAVGGNGGSGGDGGTGVDLTASGTIFTNSATVAGGGGGNGCNGGVGVSLSGSGESGGDGGAGITAASAAIDNDSGTITGGNGGVGGAAGGVGWGGIGSDGADGAGGAGIVGSDLTITNGGTISGGLGGDGTTRANAITFTGGANKITFDNSTSGLTGDIGVTGSLTFDQSSTDTTVDNLITGTGSVAKNGTAKVTLSAANTYSGGTTVTGGTLAAGSSTAFGTGGVAVASGATLDINGEDLVIGSLSDVSGAGGTVTNDGAADGSLTVGGDDSATTFSGTIKDGAKALSLAKEGTGTFTLGGTNTYTGGTTVSGGTLAITNADALGTGDLALKDGTTLSFSGTGIDLANDITVAGDPTFTVGTGNTDTISGAISDGLTPGDVVKNGDGTLILSAANSYTGATTVDAGTLNVTGSIASSSLTTVNSGATFIGAGTVGNLQVASGGTFAPGTAGVAGTSTTVSGTLTLDANSTYLVAVDPSNASYADVSGTASLHGTALAAFDTGAYVGNQYTILQSSGLGGTTFDALATTDLPAGFSANLDYAGNNVLLDLTAVLGAGDDLNTNQQRVADGLNTYFNNGGSMPPNFLAVFGLSGGNLATALSQLSGEVATGGMWGSFQMMGQFLGLFSAAPGAGAGNALSFAPDAAPVPAAALAYAPVDVSSTPAVGGWKLWGTGFGGTSSVDGNPATGSHKVDANDYGFALGADYRTTPDTVVGFALAGGRTEWDLSQGLGGGDSDAFELGLHASTRMGPSYVSAALGFANHWMTTDRYASGDHLTADYTAQSYAGRLEAGYRFTPAPSFGLTPYAALQVQHFRAPSHSETDLGGGGFALSYEAMSVTDTRGEIGLHADHATTLGGDTLLLNAGAAWAHDHSTDTSAMVGFQALPGSSFTVAGATMPQNSALVSAGAELALAANLTLSAQFEGEFASGYQSFGGAGTLRYTW